MLKYVPNALTVLRFLLIPIIVIACVQGQYILAIAVLSISGLTDILDGTIARKYNYITDFGKLMDPLADKLLVNTTMIGLIGFGFLKSPFLQKGSDILYLILTIVHILDIFRDFFVDSLRMQSVKNGVVVPASRFGKYKTATLMPGIAFLLLGSAHVVIYSIGAGLLILGGVFAIIGGVQYYLSIMPTLDK